MWLLVPFAPSEYSGGSSSFPCRSSRSTRSSTSSPLLARSEGGTSSETGKGTVRMNRMPMSIGNEVPRARRRSIADVFPGKSECARVEKKTAERPKPDMTIPVVVARCSKEMTIEIQNTKNDRKTYCLV